MQRVAQDWLVLTQLTHHDASALGIVMGLQFAPQLLLLPWTGSAADRLNQRRLLMFTQAAMGVLALVLGGLTVAGVIRLWQVYVFALLSGSAAALDAPVRQVFVSEMVGDGDLPNAVALNSTSFTAAGMIGPAIAGLLIAKVGIGWAFLLNGLSFGAVLISMYFLPSLRTPCQHEGTRRHVRLHGRASLRVEAPRPSRNPDHAVSGRHLRSKLSHLHLYDGRERLPLRCARLRPALFHHGDRHCRGGIIGCSSGKSQDSHIC